VRGLSLGLAFLVEAWMLRIRAPLRLHDMIGPGNDPPAAYGFAGHARRLGGGVSQLEAGQTPVITSWKARRGKGNRGHYAERLITAAHGGMGRTPFPNHLRAAELWPMALKALKRPRFGRP
jgi:hypothetical protein